MLKRFLPTTIATLILAFVVSVVLFVPLDVHADVYTPGDSFTHNEGASTLDKWINNVKGWFSDAAATAVDETFGRVFKWIMEIFMWVAGLFMQMCAGVFDYAMVKALDSELLGSLEAVDRGWTAFRDVANMAFIFIMLYIAIGTMLRLGGVQWKRNLASVIVVALLINFSLFFTKVIIDASNVLAIHFFNGIQTTYTDATDGSAKTSHSIADVFMEGGKLTSFFCNHLTHLMVQLIKCKR